MGYYTRHKLRIVQGDTEVDHEKQIEELADYQDLFSDTVKWYDCNKDMREYSKSYPDVLFEISGEGEEGGDIWIKYFRNGKAQLCKATITFEEYDINKLC